MFSISSTTSISHATTLPRNFVWTTDSAASNPIVLRSLIKSLTWLLIILVPLAMLIVFIGDIAPRWFGPFVAVRPPATYIPRLRGGGGESEEISPAKPGLRNPARLRERRRRQIGEHVDRFMAQRQSESTFDDGSNFSFQSEDGDDEDEYWREDSEDEQSVSETPDAMSPIRRKHKGNVPKDIIQKREGEGTAGQSSCPILSFMCKGNFSNIDSTYAHQGTLVRSPISASTSTNNSATGTGTRKSRQSSINAHIDLLTRQQRIQRTNQDHTDIPFDLQNSRPIAEEEDFEEKDFWRASEDSSEAEEGANDLLETYRDAHPSLPGSSQIHSTQTGGGDSLRERNGPSDTGTRTDTQSQNAEPEHEHEDAPSARESTTEKAGPIFSHRLPHAHRHDAELMLREGKLNFNVREAALEKFDDIRTPPHEHRHNEETKQLGLEPNAHPHPHARHHPLSYAHRSSSELAQRGAGHNLPLSQSQPSFTALWVDDPVFTPTDIVSPSVRRQVDERARAKARKAREGGTGNGYDFVM